MNHIEKLVDGYKRFRHSYFGADHVLFDRLTKQGQSPKTLVIGCCPGCQINRWKISFAPASRRPS